MLPKLHGSSKSNPDASHSDTMDPKSDVNDASSSLPPAPSSESNLAAGGDANTLAETSHTDLSPGLLGEGLHPDTKVNDGHAYDTDTSSNATLSPGHETSAKFDNTNEITPNKSNRNSYNPHNSMSSQQSNYESAAKEIEQEKQMVAALKRLSIGNMMSYDPDLPLEDMEYQFQFQQNSSPGSPSNISPLSDDHSLKRLSNSSLSSIPTSPAASPRGTIYNDPTANNSNNNNNANSLKRQSSGLSRNNSISRHHSLSRQPSINRKSSLSRQNSSKRLSYGSYHKHSSSHESLESNDVFFDAEGNDEPLDTNSLLWVPANLHPEVDPEQFKIHIKTQVEEIMERKMSRQNSVSKRSSLSSSSLPVYSDSSEDSSEPATSPDQQKLNEQQQDQSELQQGEDASQQQQQQQQQQKRVSYQDKRFSNPSLKDLTNELETLSRLAGMDSSDAVTLARTLSTSSLGFTDVEKQAIGELNSSPPHGSTSSSPSPAGDKDSSNDTLYDPASHSPTPTRRTSSVSRSRQGGSMSASPSTSPSPTASRSPARLPGTKQLDANHYVQEEFSPRAANESLHHQQGHRQYSQIPEEDTLEQHSPTQQYQYHDQNQQQHQQHYQKSPPSQQLGNPYQGQPHDSNKENQYELQHQDPDIPHRHPQHHSQHHPQQFSHQSSDPRHPQHHHQTQGNPHAYPQGHPQGHQQHTQLQPQPTYPLKRSRRLDYRKQTSTTGFGSQLQTNKAGKLAELRNNLNTNDSMLIPTKQQQQQPLPQQQEQKPKLKLKTRSPNQQPHPRSSQMLFSYRNPAVSPPSGGTTSTGGTSPKSASITAAKSSSMSKDSPYPGATSTASLDQQLANNKYGSHNKRISHAKQPSGDSTNSSSPMTSPVYSEGSGSSGNHPGGYSMNQRYTPDTRNVSHGSMTAQIAREKSRTAATSGNYSHDVIQQRANGSGVRSSSGSVPSNVDRPSQTRSVSEPQLQPAVNTGDYHGHNQQQLHQPYVTTPSTSKNDKSRQLNQNLDMLRSEINEFKESLTKADPQSQSEQILSPTSASPGPSPLQRQQVEELDELHHSPQYSQQDRENQYTSPVKNSPSPVKGDDRANETKPAAFGTDSNFGSPNSNDATDSDFSFEATYQDISYEDSLGLENEILQELSDEAQIKKQHELQLQLQKRFQSSMTNRGHNDDENDPNSASSDHTMPSGRQGHENNETQARGPDFVSNEESINAYEEHHDDGETIKNHQSPSPTQVNEPQDLDTYDYVDMQRSLSQSKVFGDYDGEKLSGNTDEYSNNKPRSPEADPSTTYPNSAAPTSQSAMVHEDELSTPQTSPQKQKPLTPSRKSLKKKKSWPWMKEKERSSSLSSVDANNLPPVPDSGDASQSPSRSVSSPEMPTVKESPRQQAPVEIYEPESQLKDHSRSRDRKESVGKESMITKFFKKKRSNSTSVAVQSSNPGSPVSSNVDVPPSPGVGSANSNHSNKSSLDSGMAIDYDSDNDARSTKSSSSKKKSGGGIFKKKHKKSSDREREKLGLMKSSSLNSIRTSHSDDGEYDSSNKDGLMDTDNEESQYAANTQGMESSQGQKQGENQYQAQNHYQNQIPLELVDDQDFNDDEQVENHDQHTQKTGLFKKHSKKDKSSEQNSTESGESGSLEGKVRSKSKSKSKKAEREAKAQEELQQQQQKQEEENAELEAQRAQRKERRHKRRKNKEKAAAAEAAAAAANESSEIARHSEANERHGGNKSVEEEKALQTTQEVQEKLKKSIKRTSRANQPIEFTDSAFGFPLPPPSQSTLVMLDYRFPVHVERAIYRLSHLKLANPKRSLREQVLLSNFMYAYLNLVDHTLHLEQQMNNEQSEHEEDPKNNSFVSEDSIEEEVEEELSDNEKDAIDVDTGGESITIDLDITEEKQAVV